MMYGYVIVYREMKKKLMSRSNFNSCVFSVDETDLQLDEVGCFIDIVYSYSWQLGCLYS